MRVVRERITSLRPLLLVRLRALVSIFFFAPMATAAPAINSVSTSLINAGGPYFQLTISGTDFTPVSQASLSGIPLDTFYDSATQLRAAITPGVRAISGRFEITVTDGSSTSNAVPLLIAPVIAGANPAALVAGSPQATITVTGIGFIPREVVVLGTASRQTTLGTSFVSSSQLTATIPADLLAAPVAATLSVTDPLYGETSTQLPFVVRTRPTITSVTPASFDAGGPYFQLTILGTGFDASAVANLGTTALVTTYMDPTQLKAAIPPELRAGSGTFDLAVTLSGGVNSMAWPLRISPVLSSVSPSSARSGSPALPIAVQGIGFTTQSKIQLTAAGQTGRLPTTYVSSTNLTATIPATLLGAPGLAALQIVNANGTDVSGVFSFPIRAAPLIASAEPNPMDAGGAGVVMTVKGVGFAAGSVLQWAGATISLTSITETQLSFPVTPEMRALSGSFPLTLTDPAGGVSAPYPVVISPVLFSIAPATAPVRSSSVTITASGVGFTRNSVLVFSGLALATTYVSSTSLTAKIPASALGIPGRAAIQVMDAGGPGHSLEQPFQITGVESPPSIASLTPASAPAGSPAITITIAGDNFVPAAAAQWNTTALATTFVSATQLTVAVPAALLSTAGAAAITVAIPGGASASAATFTVTSASSASSILAALNAFSAKPSAAPGSLISIYGSNLASTVTVNGAAAPVLYAGDGQINAQVPFETRLGLATIAVPGAEPKPLEIAAIAPGILTGVDNRYAIAQDVAGALITPVNPVAPGEYATLYLTGQGLLDRTIASGAKAPADPLLHPLASVQAAIADSPALVSFAGLAPGLIGVLQVNILIPEIPEGDQPLAVTIGGVPANLAVLPIRRAPGIP